MIIDPKHSGNFLVVEDDTGYVDGYYSTRDIAENTAKRWSERRPEHTHSVKSVPDEERTYIPDHVFLPIQHAEAQLSP